MQETQVWSLGQEDPLEKGRREWLPTPVFLPGESHRQRRVVGYSPSGHKELDATNIFTFYKLEQNALREIIAFISNAVTAYYFSESSLLLIMPILDWFFTFQVQTGFHNTFISLLMNLFPPESVCGPLHLCPSSV